VKHCKSLHITKVYHLKLLYLFESFRFKNEILFRAIQASDKNVSSNQENKSENVVDSKEQAGDM